ncbi:hypothetical protein BH10PAT4_BH10PAT4_5100 [soil metagenome]
MKKLLALVIALFAVLFVPTAGHAAGYGEKIDSYDSQVTVHRDNSVSIVETIAYDFKNNSHHGIYRDIPIDYHDGSTTYYLDFRLNSVRDDSGASLQTQTTTENGNKRIRIGVPDASITGLHTYQISYVLSPIIYQNNGKPFLNLDIIGQGWEVPIYNISARVSLEGEAALSNVVWFGAPNQSELPNQLLVSSIGAYQGITINANMPSNYVSTYLQPNKPRLEDVIASIWNVVIIVGICLSFAITIAIIAARTIRTYLRRKHQIVVAQYEPPTALSPAHIGLLEDDRAEGRELTATVIDWAVRGYIKIIYIPKKGFFGSTDYTLEKLKSSTDLPENEAGLFNAFFKTEGTATISKLDKSAVSTQVTTFKTSLKSSLTNRGYYQKQGQIFMRGTLTEEGAKEWALVDGFRLYLSVVEKDRLKFSDAPEKTPERFSKLLPYAIALGVEKQWAKQFKEIDLTESTDWYTGNFAAFSAVALVSDLSSSFATTVSSNTSVSSGGGSSGGGFGGGGGGSW